MAKVICIMGESGSGKTTSCRNLDPMTTYYIDKDDILAFAGELSPEEDSKEDTDNA